jgi:hypothetical protein
MQIHIQMVLCKMNKDDSGIHHFEQNQINKDIQINMLTKLCVYALIKQNTAFLTYICTSSYLRELEKLFRNVNCVLQVY